MSKRTTGTAVAACMAAVALLLGACTIQETAVTDGELRLPGADYHLLMAQIAAARERHAAAAEAYLRAAEHSNDPQASEEAARFALNHGFDAWALRAARRWVELVPADAGARRLLARLLLRRNDIGGAVLHAEAALGAIDSRSDADYAQLAAKLAKEENLEGNSRLWARLADHAPRAHGGLQEALASAALRAGDVSLALAAARAAGDRDTASPEARQLLGRALLASGDPEAAFIEAGRQMSRHPGVDADLEYANLLAAADRLAEAEAMLTTLEHRHGEQPAARRLRGLLSIDAGDHEAAWDIFQGLVSNDEYGEEAYYRLAELAMGQQQADVAVQMLSRVEGGPYLLPARDALARLLAAGGDLQTAMQLLDAFATLHPEQAAEVSRRQAALLEARGMTEEAIEAWSDIIRHQPDDAWLRLRRGILLEEQGRTDAALDDMAKAAVLMPDDASVLNAWGYTLADHDMRLTRARSLVRRALERRPDNPAILDSYGWLLYREGRLAEARSYLELAHSQLPEAEVAAHLGEVLWQQGEEDRARGLWEDALMAEPMSPVLQDTMARFLED